MREKNVQIAIEQIYLYINAGLWAIINNNTIKIETYNTAYVCDTVNSSFRCIERNLHCI